MNKINMYDLEPSELGAMLEGPSFGRHSAKLDLQKKCDKFQDMNNLPKKIIRRLWMKSCNGGRPSQKSKRRWKRKNIFLGCMTA